MADVPVPPLAPRSGDRILNTTLITGLTASLFSPWLKAALGWVEAHTIVTFTDDYLQQLLTAIGFGAVYVIGRLQMRSMRNESPPTTDVGVGVEASTVPVPLVKP